MTPQQAVEKILTPVEYLEDVEDWFKIERRPLPWQKLGLQQTASGYGAKLATQFVVQLRKGRARRVYVTQYSNAGSAWIVVNGRKLFLRDTDLHKS